MKTFSIESLKNLVRVDNSIGGSNTALTETQHYKQLATLFGENNPEKCYTKIDFNGTSATITDRNGKNTTLDCRAAFLFALGECKTFDDAQAWLNIVSEGAIIRYRGIIGTVPDFQATMQATSPLIDTLLTINGARLQELSALSDNPETLLILARSIVAGKAKELAGINLKDETIVSAAKAHVEQIEQIEREKIEQERRLQLEKQLSSVISIIKGKIGALGLNHPHSIFPSRNFVVFRVGPYAVANRKLSELQAITETFDNGLTFEFDSSENAELADCVFLKVFYSEMTIPSDTNDSEKAETE